MQLREVLSNYLIKYMDPKNSDFSFHKQSTDSYLSETPSMMLEKSNYISSSQIKNMRLEEDFFEKIIELECLIQYDFSIDKLNALVGLYMEAIEFFQLTKDFERSNDYQTRMHSRLAEPYILKKMKESTKFRSQNNTSQSFKLPCSNDLAVSDTNYSNVGAMSSKSLLKENTINKLKMKINFANSDTTSEVKTITQNLAKEQNSKSKVNFNNVVTNDIEKQTSNLRERLEERRRLSRMALTNVNIKESEISPINSTKSLDNKNYKGFKANEDNAQSTESVTAENQELVVFHRKSPSNHSFKSEKEDNNANSKPADQQTNSTDELTKKPIPKAQSPIKNDKTEDKLLLKRGPKGKNLSISIDNGASKDNSNNDNETKLSFPTQSAESEKENLNQQEGRYKRMSLNNRMNQTLSNLKSISANFINEFVEYYYGFIVRNFLRDLLDKSHVNFIKYSENIKTSLLNIRELEVNMKEGNDVQKSAFNILVEENKEELERTIEDLNEVFDHQLRTSIESFKANCFKSEFLDLTIEKWKFEIINEITNSISLPMYK